MPQNYINHIVFCLDESGSMWPHKDTLVKVVDSQVAYLAQRSKELNQETRVTVYTFSNTVRCLFYDMDVLRLPSLRDLYRPGNLTALVDATMQSIEELALTPEIYGEHAFLVYVLTDGGENASHRYSAAALKRKLEALPAHWTVAVLAPDQICKHEAKKFGFPADNIAIWDATTTRGVVEVGRTIREATDQFMVNRSKGVRGTKNLFSLADVDSTVVRNVLTPLTGSQYMMIPVVRETQIRPWVEECGHTYVVGRAYYQLNKPETIQPQKKLAVFEKKTGKVYVGENVRQLVGLPDTVVRVKPDFNPDYSLFVQSTSVNRKLVPGTQLLLLLTQ